MVSVFGRREDSNSLVCRQQAQGSPLVDNYLLPAGHADIQQLVDNIVEGDLLSFFHLWWNTISFAFLP